jgi:ABC-type microcin C transport system duplicated ATPase subunit YejF
MEKQLFQENGKQVLVLEPSTNTHRLTADEIEFNVIDNGIVAITVKSGSGVVTHGEQVDGLILKGNHGTVRTESKNVIKYVQQEYNPVTQQMQNAFD